MLYKTPTQIYVQLPRMIQHKGLKHHTNPDCLNWDVSVHIEFMYMGITYCNTIKIFSRNKESLTAAQQLTWSSKLFDLGSCRRRVTEREEIFIQ